MADRTDVSVPRTPWSRIHRSLRWRLPLLVALLIVGTLATFAVMTDREVEQLLTRAGGLRAQAATEQLASLLAPSAVQRMLDIRRVAGDPALSAYLTRAHDSSKEAAERVLRSLITPGSQVIQLWDRAGQLAMSIASPPTTEALFPAAQPPTQSGLRLIQRGPSPVISDLAEPVRPAGATQSAEAVGYLVLRRPVSSASSSETLNKLLGGGARIKLGSKDGGAWTDLSHIVSAPPVDFTHEGVSIYGADGDVRVGSLRELIGTPWLIWVEFPRSLLLAPARAFRQQMLLMSLGLIGIALVLSSVVTRRITTPLVTLTEASEAVAAGRWEVRRHVKATRTDEIGRLGSAFNRMIGELQAAHERLETRVQERELALAALSESRDRYRAIVDVALDCILMIDRRGAVTEFNPAAERTFGCRKSDAIGRQLSTLIVPPEDQDADQAALARFLTTGEGPALGRLVELSGLHADGHQFPVELAIQATVLNGEPMFTVYVRDIGERKRADDVRHHAIGLEVENRRVQQATRLKSEFLANMSHELRTPLNAIIGFSAILHDDTGRLAHAEREEFAGHIQTSGRHLLKLINEVLDLSKVEAGKVEFRPESLRVLDLMAEVRDILEPTAQAKQIDLRTFVDSSVTMVELDPARLKQVLYNYLSNALKFTPPGGTVSARVLPNGPDMFRVEVEDSGIGIAPGDVGKLFVEFQQLDAGDAKQHGGTGLGLALTKRLVEAQGGTVGVRSTLGVGSVFHAVLPRRHTVGARYEQIRAPITPGGGPSVLVIEDDPQDRRRIVDALAGAGFAVEAVASGKEAVDRCRGHEFDAVTLDLLLPDQSGLDVLAQLRRVGKNPNVPVVIVSVVAEHQALTGHVVSDILRKPLDPEALLASLGRAGVQPRRPNRILVVDDDEASVRLVSACLERVGYDVEGHTDPVKALASAKVSPPAAIVLDLVMPGLDGLQFVHELRTNQATRGTPVVVWTVHELSSRDRAQLQESVRAVLRKDQGDLDLLLAEIRLAASHVHSEG